MSENGSRNKKLTSKQYAAMAALLDGKSYSQAALVAGVSERTVFRWRDEVAEFNDELERRGRRAIRDATTQLTGGLETAISFLLAVVVDQDAHRLSLAFDYLWRRPYTVTERRCQMRSTSDTAYYQPECVSGG